MRGILIEGVNGAGKTSVYQRIIKSIASEAPDAFVSMSQQYTQRLIPVAVNQVDDGQLFSLYEPVIDYLHTLQEQFCSSQFSYHPRSFSIQPKFVVESTHFNCLVEFGLPITSRMKNITHRLRDVGGKLVLLTVPSEHIYWRCIESTRRIRSSGWAVYLQQLADSDDELVRIFQGRQERLVEMVRDAELPILEICTANQDWDCIVDKCLQFVFQDNDHG